MVIQMVFINHILFIIHYKIFSNMKNIENTYIYNTYKHYIKLNKINLFKSTYIELLEQFINHIYLFFIFIFVYKYKD